MTEGTILLAEDNRDDEALILRTLRNRHIANEIVVVRDGVEALDYLFSTGQYEDKPLPHPIVVLLDIKMPKISGIEVLERIRADRRTRKIPVVMLTSSLESQDLTRCYELGVNSYVRKPVDFSEFSDAVEQLGLYWLLINQPPGPPDSEST